MRLEFGSTERCPVNLIHGLLNRQGGARLMPEDRFLDRFNQMSYGLI